MAVFKNMQKEPSSQTHQPKKPSFLAVAALSTRQKSTSVKTFDG
jgi:hypothetical protein